MPPALSWSASLLLPGASSDEFWWPSSEIIEPGRCVLKAFLERIPAKQRSKVAKVRRKLKRDALARRDFERSSC